MRAKAERFEIGQAEGKTHFKFTNNLLFEILLAGVEPDKKLEELQRSLRAVAKLMKVCQLTGILGGWSVRGVRRVGRCFTPCQFIDHLTNDVLPPLLDRLSGTPKT